MRARRAPTGSTPQCGSPVPNPQQSPHSISFGRANGPRTRAAEQQSVLSRPSFAPTHDPSAGRDCKHDQRMRTAAICAGNDGRYFRSTPFCARGAPETSYATGSGCSDGTGAAPAGAARRFRPAPDTIVRQTRRTYSGIADRNTFPNAQPRIKRDCFRLVGQPRAQSGRAPAKRRDGNTPRCERSARNEPEARHESMRSLPQPDNAPHRTPTPPRRFAADDPKHLRPPIRSSKRRSAAAAERSDVSAGSVPQASPPNSIR